MFSLCLRGFPSAHQIHAGRLIGHSIQGTLDTWSFVNTLSAGTDVIIFIINM